MRFPCFASVVHVFPDLFWAHGGAQGGAHQGHVPVFLDYPGLGLARASLFFGFSGVFTVVLFVLFFMFFLTCSGSRDVFPGLGLARGRCLLFFGVFSLFVMFAS